MKHIKLFIATMLLLYSEATLPKEAKPEVTSESEAMATANRAARAAMEARAEEERRHPSSKKVKLFMYPAPSLNVQIDIVPQPDMTGSRINVPAKSRFVSTQRIYRPTTGKKIEFFIAPSDLNIYCNASKDNSKDYNPHSKLKTTGAQRLLEALSTSVSYDFDTLPEEIILPSPVAILNDLLGCSC
jgi:hypothetical protein